MEKYASITNKQKTKPTQNEEFYPAGKLPLWTPLVRPDWLTKGFCLYGSQHGS